MVYQLKKETNSNDESQSNSKLTYVGDMYIEGAGNYETSNAMATSEKDLKIGVGLKGTDVILEAKYLLQCP